VVVVGGPLVPVGGHNLSGAAAVSRPIVVGPHVEAIADLVARFEAGGAIVRVSGADPARAVAEACRRLFDDPERARMIGEAGHRVWQDGAGTADRYLNAIVDRLGRTAG